jgi:uncharacterized protein with FMN-binding domain
VRTRAVVGSIFGSLAALVVGWQVGAAQLATDTTTSQTTTSSGGTTSSTGSSSDSSSSSSTSTDSSSGTSSTTDTPAATVQTGAADGTYTGSSVDTRFGSVQVAVTISGGAITDVTALHLTDTDRKSIQISNRAAPILRDEVIASQSASVANVSGATYTTRAYLESVQSALDQAGF